LQRSENLQDAWEGVDDVLLDELLAEAEHTKSVGETEADGLPKLRRRLWNARNSVRFDDER
jgi:hypothetical protein